jgi:hypothetical protein
VRNRRDAAGHVGVEDRGEAAEHDDPREAHAETGARFGVAHEIPDVDHPADRGQDPKRELERLLHPYTC